MEGRFQNVFYEILNFFTNIGWSIIIQLRIIDRSSSKKIAEKVDYSVFTDITLIVQPLSKHACTDRQALQIDSEPLLE